MFKIYSKSKKKKGLFSKGFLTVQRGCLLRPNGTSNTLC